MALNNKGTYVAFIAAALRQLASVLEQLARSQDFAEIGELISAEVYTQLDQGADRGEALLVDDVRVARPHLG
jgi:predicted lipid-binding transport protein (Tim44 family)